MTSTTYHHGDLREALVRAAVAAVREQGADGLALRELARRVGVSHNAAYRHFANRDELLSEVAGRVMDQLVERMTTQWDRVETDDPVLRARRHLIEVGRAYVEFALAEPGLFSLAISSLTPERMKTPLGPYELLSRALDEQVEVGFLAPEARVGAEVACWSAVHGFSMLAIGGAFLGETAEVRANALDSVLLTIDRSYAATTGREPIGP